MKNTGYLLVGVVFGLALTKGEAISWYRIQEMFRFESFHMYGIFMTAVSVGSVSILLLKKLNIKTRMGEPIEISPKHFHPGIIIGSLIFGFGWALTGACPGPLYIQIGSGYGVVIITLLSAIGGVWVFGKIQHRLP
ncbi:MAG: YeeE/YedE family protein [Bacteroidetes bacterium]|nr:YeeE/YedE family protein [Bacteroidota bacterium]MBS1540630.1 YeeE/YedE family protein [Bacteroidota bacterium]